MTRYYYPTWADILGKVYNYSENWGKPSSGNHYIFNSVIECDLRNKFTHDDTVLILWSAHGRYDFYQFDKWISVADAWPDTHGFNNYPCPTGYELINYAFIHILHHYLMQKKVNFRFMQWTDLNLDTEVSQLYQESLTSMESFIFQHNDKLYNPWEDDDKILSEKIKNLYDVTAGPSWPAFEHIMDKSYYVEDKFIQKEINQFLEQIEIEKKQHKFRMRKDEKIVDGHPLPTQHFNAVKKMFPQITLSDEIYQWVSDIEDKIISNQPFTFDSVGPKKRF